MEPGLSHRVLRFYIDHVNDVGVYLGRQRGGKVLGQKNKLETFCCSFWPKCWSFKCSQNKKLLLLVQNEERVCKMHSFERGPLLPFVHVSRQREGGILGCSPVIRDTLI